MDVPLCKGCGDRDARIAELEARVAQLQAQSQDQARLLVDLARKLQNQDLPTAGPQAQPPPSKPAAKPPSGRKPGGQPGHPPHLKQLLPPERVTTTVPLVPTHCQRCQTPLPAERGPEDPEPSRFQVAELPELKAQVTEYQGRFRTCPGCGTLNHAPITAEVRAHSTGPRPAATLAYLAGCHHVSKRGLEEVVETVFEVPLASGTVSHPPGTADERRPGPGPHRGRGRCPGGAGQAC